MSKLNVTTYSVDELVCVRHDCRDWTKMVRLINELLRYHTSPYSDSVIRDKGQQLSLSSEASCLVSHLEANRRLKKTVKSPPIAGDDDVLTVGQLREAFREIARGFSQGRWVTVGNADDIVDQVMERVNEPWITGDIVTDATGAWYKRTGTGQWAIFGNSGYVPDSMPVRPLKKMN